MFVDIFNRSSNLINGSSLHLLTCVKKKNLFYLHIQIKVLQF